MPVHTFTNWNSRASDQEIQIEPFRKYYFICEGVIGSGLLCRFSGASNALHLQKPPHQRVDRVPYFSVLDVVVDRVGGGD